MYQLTCLHATDSTIYTQMIDAEQVTFAEGFVIFVDTGVVVFCIQAPRMISCERVENISEIHEDDSPVLQSLDEALSA